MVTARQHEAFIITDPVILSEDENMDRDPEGTEPADFESFFHK